MTIYSRSEVLVSRCIECDLAEPESLTSLGGSAPGVVDGILSQVHQDWAPGLATSPVCLRRLSLQTPGPNQAFSPSVTSTPLPASGHLHQPSRNQTVILTQCHSTWPCNNPTVTSLSRPWHVNWVNTWNSSPGRLSTSPKSRRMPSPFPWYGPSSANVTLQEKS